MAKPIKPTPVLKGKAALHFVELMEKPKKLSKEVRERMRSNYERLRINSEL